jgi:CheY-like chemotaxis protein
MNSGLNFSKQPKGLFVFVDDDPDEHELLKLAVERLGLSNEVKSFLDGEAALSFLKECREDIFMILSDLNMPMMDGLTLKRLIDLIPELKVKAIPFFFHSNTSSLAEMRSAYGNNIQGFLRKADSIDETVDSLTAIINLWTKCIHPKDIRAQVTVTK